MSDSGLIELIRYATRRGVCIFFRPERIGDFTTETLVTIELGEVCIQGILRPYCSDEENILTIRQMLLQVLDKQREDGANVVEFKRKDSTNAE